MDRRDFQGRFIMWLNYIPSHTGGFGCNGELVLCYSCLNILSSGSAVISKLLIRSHLSDVTAGGVIGPVLPRIIAGNSSPSPFCYQDADLTTHSLVKPRKTSCCKAASETSPRLCPHSAVCSLRDNITLFTQLGSFQWEEIQLAPGVLTPLLANWARLEITCYKILFTKWRSQLFRNSFVSLKVCSYYNPSPAKADTDRSQFLVVNIDIHWHLL